MRGTAAPSWLNARSEVGAPIPCWAASSKAPDHVDTEEGVAALEVSFLDAALHRRYRLPVRVMRAVLEQRLTQLQHGTGVVQLLGRNVADVGAVHQRQQVRLQGLLRIAWQLVSIGSLGDREGNSFVISIGSRVNGRLRKFGGDIFSSFSPVNDGSGCRIRLPKTLRRCRKC